MSAHTPGPWANECDCDEEPMCAKHKAAPALLEALERAVYAESLVGAARAAANDALYGPDGMASAAIAQAKGEK